LSSRGNKNNTDALLGNVQKQFESGENHTRWLTEDMKAAITNYMKSVKKILVKIDSVETENASDDEASSAKPQKYKEKVISEFDLGRPVKVLMRAMAFIEKAWSADPEHLDKELKWADLKDRFVARAESIPMAETVIMNSISDRFANFSGNPYTHVDDSNTDPWHTDPDGLYSVLKLRLNTAVTNVSISVAPTTKEIDDFEEFTDSRDIMRLVNECIPTKIYQLARTIVLNNFRQHHQLVFADQLTGAVRPLSKVLSELFLFGQIKTDGFGTKGAPTTFKSGDRDANLYSGPSADTDPGDVLGISASDEMWKKSARTSRSFALYVGKDDSNATINALTKSGILEQMERSRIPILIYNSAGDTGVDYKNITAHLMMDFAANPATKSQRIGRAHRHRAHHDDFFRWNPHRGSLSTTTFVSTFPALKERSHRDALFEYKTPRWTNGPPPIPDGVKKFYSHATLPYGNEEAVHGFLDALLGSRRYDRAGNMVETGGLEMYPFSYWASPSSSLVPEVAVAADAADENDENDDNDDNAGDPSTSDGTGDSASIQMNSRETIFFSEIKRSKKDSTALNKAREEKVSILKGLITSWVEKNGATTAIMAYDAFSTGNMSGVVPGLAEAIVSILTPPGTDPGGPEFRTLMQTILGGSKWGPRSPTVNPFLRMLRINSINAKDDSVTINTLLVVFDNVLEMIHKRLEVELTSLRGSAGFWGDDSTANVVANYVYYVADSLKGDVTERVSTSDFTVGTPLLANMLWIENLVVGLSPVTTRPPATPSMGHYASVPAVQTLMTLRILSVVRNAVARSGVPSMSVWKVTKLNVSYETAIGQHKKSSRAPDETMSDHLLVYVRDGVLDSSAFGEFAGDPVRDAMRDLGGSIVKSVIETDPVDAGNLERRIRLFVDRSFKAQTSHLGYARKNMDMKWADDSQTSLSMALQDYNAMLRLDSMEADRDHYTAVMNSGSVGNQMWMPVCDLGDSSLLPSKHVKKDYSEGRERGDLFYGPLMYRYLNAGDPFMLEATMKDIRARSDHLSKHPDELSSLLKETQTKWARYYLMCSRENTALRESVKSSVGLTNTISDVDAGAVAVYGSTDKIYSRIEDTDKSGAGMAALRAIYDDMVPTADKAVTTNSFAGVPLDLSNYKKGLEAVTGLTFAEDEDFYRYLIEKVVAINTDPVDHVLSPTGLMRYSIKFVSNVTAGWVVEEIQSLMMSLHETRTIDPDGLHTWLNDDNNAHKVTDRAIKRRLVHGYRLESEIGFIDNVVVPMMGRRDTLLMALKQLSGLYGDDQRSHDETVLIALLMGRDVDRRLSVAKVPTARWLDPTVNKETIDTGLTTLYWWNAASGHHTNEYSLGDAVRADLVRTMSIGDEPPSDRALFDLVRMPQYSVYEDVARWMGISFNIAEIGYTDTVHEYGTLVLSVIGKVEEEVTSHIVLGRLKGLIGDTGLKKHFELLDNAGLWVRKRQRRLTDSTASTLDAAFEAMNTETPSTDPTVGGFMVTVNNPKVYDQLKAMSPDEVERWINRFTLPYADPDTNDEGVPVAWDGMRPPDLRGARGLTVNQVAILLEAEAVDLHVPSDDEDDDLEGDIARREAAAAKRQNESMKTTDRTKSATGSGSGGSKTPARTPKGKKPTSAPSETPVKRGRESMGKAGNPLKQTDTKGTPEKDN
jgi:hypothetical protein